MPDHCRLCRTPGPALCEPCARALGPEVEAALSELEARPELHGALDAIAAAPAELLRLRRGRP